jgi:hypothetical protein
VVATAASRVVATAVFRVVATVATAVFRVVATVATAVFWVVATVATAVFRAGGFVADVVEAKCQATVLLGTLEDALGQRPLEHRRKESEDVDAHGVTMRENPAFFNVLALLRQFLANLKDLLLDTRISRPRITATLRSTQGNDQTVER